MLIDVNAKAWTNPPLSERFWARVDKSGSCWIWTGRKSERGYGRIQHQRRQHGAHRVAYMLLVGEIPDDLVLDHLCRNPSCVNPAHLEAVTQRENILRGEGMGAKAARATHCKNGHEWTPENTYAFSPHRKCKRCHSQAMKDTKMRKNLPKAPKCHRCNLKTWNASGFCHLHDAKAEALCLAV